MIIKMVVMAVCIALSAPVEAKIKRSAKAKAEFKLMFPCPSTGLSKGSCPGYIVDHVEPLCAGGLDKPINMQWQTEGEAKVKDRLERRLCRVNKW
jgi:hypothetical protein